MPFCPEGFSPEPPLSRVVIAPDMTEPMVKYLNNPITLAKIKDCLAAGMTKASQISAAIGRDQYTVRKYLRQMREGA